MKLKHLIGSNSIEEKFYGRLVTNMYRNEKVSYSPIRMTETYKSSFKDISQSLYNSFRLRASWITYYNEIATVFDSDSIDVIHRAKTISLSLKVLEILQDNYDLDEVLVFKTLKQMLKDRALKLHPSFGDQNFSIKSLREYVNRQLAIDINNN